MLPWWENILYFGRNSSNIFRLPELLKKNVTNPKDKWKSLYVASTAQGHNSDT